MKKYLAAIAIICSFALLTTIVSASLTPDTFSATLSPGQSVSEHKTVFLPGVIPKGDVVFAFDCTGSMSDAIGVAETQAVSIMNTLGTLITDVQFGVISFMDYPHSYSSFGYSAAYGDPAYGDYAYKLDQPITADKTAVSNAIGSLLIGYGADGPQDYARIFFESYSDASIGWRTGAKHFLIILGDSVPHYENLNEGISPVNYTTGGDPGRDEIMFTPDDIYLPTTLQNMATHSITLLYIKCHTGAFPSDTSNVMYWTYWTGITGGAAYDLSSASGIPAAIQALVSAQAAHVNKLTLKPDAGYETWLTSVVPPEYDDITIPPEGVTKEFDITLTIPLGTAPGTYVFNITADADGASYGGQRVTIVVMSPRALKTDAITELIAARPLATKSSTIWEIDGAIYDIQMSLYPSYWMDDSHVNGLPVFYWERYAIVRLTTILKSNLESTSFMTTIQAIIGKLLKADDWLASTAIKDAKNLGSTKPAVILEIKLADQAYYKATHTSDSVYALDQFEMAWYDAETAIGLAK
jgi:hypothetical protein